MGGTKGGEQGSVAPRAVQNGRGRGGACASHLAISALALVGDCTEIDLPEAAEGDGAALALGLGDGSVGEHLPRATKGSMVRRACHVSPREVW